MTDATADRRRSPARRLARFVGHGLWALIPVLSIGLLAWLPAVQAWWKSRTAGWGLTTLALALGSVAIATGMASQWTSSSFLGLILIGSGVGGVAAALTGRRIVFEKEEDVRRVDPHVARVLDQRSRRREARRIVETDPQMAVELHIGRPDLPRSFDDGGVIDLNNATAGAIAYVLDWSLGTARAFVAERDARSGYESLRELAAMSSIAPKSLDGVSDRIVLLPYVRTLD